MTGQPLWLEVVALLISAGVLAYLRDVIVALWKRRRAKLTPAQEQQAQVHAEVAQAGESVLVVARARDELVEDNARLRAERIEVDARHREERADWHAERQRLRDEIDELRRRMQLALDELDGLRRTLD